MTNNQEGKQKKLTLGSSKLSLNKPIEQTNITKNFITSTSKTIVEVKKSKLSANALSFDRIGRKDVNDNIELISEEFNKRLNVLKRAAEEARSKDVEYDNISTLTKLAIINQPISKEEEPTAVNKDNSEVQSSIDKESELSTNLLSEKQSLKEKPNVTSSQNYSEIIVDDVIEKEKNVVNKALSPKIKIEEPKKLRKTDIFSMLNADENDGLFRTRSLASIKRAREKEKRKAEQQTPGKVYREVIIPEFITVSDLANRMSERVSDVINELTKLNVSRTARQSIDADTAELVVTTLGHTTKRIYESDVENIIISSQVDKLEDLKPRAPIVTIMGHVDHGKTSLLDALKSTDIVSNEVGGITQHIGAYRVILSNDKAITFIDTPGHEAFSAMRMRGAQVTDIVVLIVAADDGIKPQTVEAINHAKSAKVPIIVAINKIDKPDVNIDSIKHELLTYGLVSEEFGGDTIIVPVSALKKINLDKLEEAILLVAEMQDLKVNPNGFTEGVVIEGRVDKGRGGVIATILVQCGTLKKGDIVVTGTTYGKVKYINNDRGIEIIKAEPTIPVEVYGFNKVPQAGDKFNIVQNEKQARDIIEYRERIIKERKISITKESSVEDLFIKASSGSKEKELSVIIKGDVHGSIEAIITTILKLPNDEINLKILHHAVGNITESDVSLAKASNAIIIGFNVRANNNALIIADKEKVDIRYYSIIYNLLDDIKSIMNGMLDPILHEQFIGSAEVRQIFNISKIGKIAGCYVTKGIIRKGAGARLLRDNIVVHEGKLKTLKRFKEEVKEVRENFECGIAFENYNDIKEGDVIEAFEVIEEKNKIL